MVILMMRMMMVMMMMMMRMMMNRLPIVVTISLPPLTIGAMYDEVLHLYVPTTDIANEAKPLMHQDLLFSIDDPPPASSLPPLSASSASSTSYIYKQNSMIYDVDHNDTNRRYHGDDHDNNNSDPLNPHHHPFHLLLSGQGAGPVAEEDEVQWEQRGTQTVLRYQGTVNSGQQMTILKTKEWKYCTVARLRKIPLFCTKVAKKIIFCRVR